MLEDYILAGAVAGVLTGHLSLLHGIMVVWVLLKERASVPTDAPTPNKGRIGRVFLMASVPFVWTGLGVVAGVLFYFLDFGSPTRLPVIINVSYLIIVLVLASFATIVSLVLVRNLFKYVWHQIAIGAAIFALLLPNLAALLT